jgi:transcriptional regulator with XRE-family HTH domain
MIEWIKAELKRQKRTQRALAKAMGVNPSQVTLMLQGKRDIKADELEILSAFFGKPVPAPGAMDSRRAAPVQSVPVQGVLGVGMWFERGTTLGSNGVHHVPWVPDPRLHGMPQYARLVETENDQVSRGDYAIFVPFDMVRRAPQDGDLVHAMQIRDHLEEHSLRLVKVKGNKVELHAGGDRPHLNWAANSASVRIEGLFVGSFRPPRTTI